MNTMLVYFLMLKPAIVALVLLIGIPTLVGFWLAPYVSGLLPKRTSRDNQDRRNHAVS